MGQKGVILLYPPRCHHGFSSPRTVSDGARHDLVQDENSSHGNAITCLREQDLPSGIFMYPEHSTVETFNAPVPLKWGLNEHSTRMTTMQLQGPCLALPGKGMGKDRH